MDVGQVEKAMQAKNSTLVKLRIPLNVPSDHSPWGAGSRRVVLLPDAVDLDAVVGVPITYKHHLGKCVEIDSKRIGRVVKAAILCDHLVLLGECDDGPIELACSWGVKDVELESRYERMWKVTKCRFIEFALLGNPAFSGATCEIVG
jgi:hypothetical protein